VPSSNKGAVPSCFEHDLEDVVAKRKLDPYLVEHASWLTTRNQGYSQWVGREEMFERERGSDPELRVWDTCTLACEMVGCPPKLS
jgi:hypothetical protein